MSPLQDNPEDGRYMFSEKFVKFFHSTGYHIPKYRPFFRYCENFISSINHIDCDTDAYLRGLEF